MAKNTNEEVITCNDPNIKGEKIIQIALNQEQRLCLLDAIVCSKRKYACLLPVIDELEKHVRKEDPKIHETMCLRCSVSSICR